MEKQTDEKTNENAEFEKFDTFVRRLVKVSKREIEDREKNERQKKEERKVAA